MRILLIIGAFTGLLAITELVGRRLTFEAETVRKIAHTLSALGAALLPLIASFAEIAAVASIFIVLMTISRWLGLFRSLHITERESHGEIYFPVAVFLTAVLYPNYSVYAYALLVMGFADSAASLMGRRFGRAGYQVFGNKKTYVGSASFAFVTIALTSMWFSEMTTFQIPELVAVSLTASLVLAVIEAVSVGGSDNITVALSAGLFAQLLLN